MPAADKPGRDCPRCPRLVAFRSTWRAKEPAWFNAPVPSFGPLDARVLIVGLAPGLQGANRTGRPFTGDHAGVLLYETLARYDFSRGTFDARADDGLHLTVAPVGTIGVADPGSGFQGGGGWHGHRQFSLTGGAPSLNRLFGLPPEDQRPWP